MRVCAPSLVPCTATPAQILLLSLSHHVVEPSWRNPAIRTARDLIPPAAARAATAPCPHGLPPCRPRPPSGSRPEPPPGQAPEPPSGVPPGTPAACCRSACRSSPWPCRRVMPLHSASRATCPRRPPPLRPSPPAVSSWPAATYASSISRASHRRPGRHRHQQPPASPMPAPHPPGHPHLPHRSPGIPHPPRRPPDGPSEPPRPATGFMPAR